MPRRSSSALPVPGSSLSRIWARRSSIVRLSLRFVVGAGSAMAGGKIPERGAYHVLAISRANAGDRCLDQFELLLIEHQFDGFFPLRHAVLRRSFAGSVP